MPKDEQPSLDTLAFLDIEASGLGPDSFPIEIGWAFATGSSGSFLVRPVSTWSMDAWDPAAEDLHGISWAELLKTGISAWDAALRINALLVPGGAPLTVVSDATEMDSFWLDLLFEESPEDRAFQLHDVNWLWAVLPPSNPIDAAVDDTRPHRAEADAQALASAWMSALQLGSTRVGPDLDAIDR